MAATIPLARALGCNAGRQVGERLPSDARLPAPMPPVCIVFGDPPGCFNEEAADFLNDGFRRPPSPEAGSAADRILKERHAGTYQKPGRDVELTPDEKRHVLEVLNAGGWPERNENQLRHLQSALVVDLEPMP
jgi:hypothetical protein